MTFRLMLRPPKLLHRLAKLRDHDILEDTDGSLYLVYAGSDGMVDVRNDAFLLISQLGQSVLP